MNILENESLAKYTTFFIGGAAKYFISVCSINELKDAILFAKEKKLSFFILGKGSNILFDDKGYHGLVIQNRIGHCKIEGAFIDVGAGFSFSHLGLKTAKKNLSGLEFACGIPASVGGAVFMNAGANTQATWDLLHSVTYLDEHSDLQTQNKEAFSFGYRYSCFQNTNHVIVSATFLLKEVSQAKEFQKELISYRTNTQPYGEKSAGCIFRNPEGAYAGALIDQCNLKGICIGRARVSETHANFIVTEKGATSRDIHLLIELVKKIVLEKTGFDLKPEVRVVPYES